MAKKRAPATKPEPTPTNDWLSNPEIRQALESDYNRRMDDASGTLHNRFVAYISESQLPLPLVLLVVSLLYKELMEQCKTKYLGSG